MKLTLLPVLVLSIFLAACTTTKPVRPYTEAEQLLLNRFKTDFDAGQYKELIAQIKATHETKNGTADFRQEALKYQAFSECLSKMPRSCRATFRTLFSEDPSFALNIAEEGHPTWGPIYQSEQKRAARLVKPQPSAKP